MRAILSSLLLRRVTLPTWAVLTLGLLAFILHTNSIRYSYNPRNLAKIRLGALQKDYDAERDTRDWDIRLGKYGLDDYTAELRAAHRNLFGSSSTSSAPRTIPASHPVPWSAVNSYLRLDLDLSKATIPHRVWTTSGVPPEKYPEQFRYWVENDASLTFRHLNDTVLDAYLGALYPSGTPMANLLNHLPKMVLKSDIMRYSLLLHRGGIYTDTDTAAVRKFDEWGTIDTVDLTDQVVASVPQLLRGDLSLSQSLPPPALIVSIEMNGKEPQWREKTMARGLQIVQWTIAARAAHPVFLDVLSRIWERWDKGIKLTGDLENPDVLQWTGPGPWTDAVLRYLVARHGIEPREIANAGVPVRVGDVLILPHASFQASASEGPQSAQACVWHGFLGSLKES